MTDEKGWSEAGYFEFEYSVHRNGRETARWHHAWDRNKNMIRVSGARGSDSISVITRADDPMAGLAYVNRRLIGGPRADSLLQLAFVRWSTDSYWLLMPYLWKQPGVHTQFLGLQRDDAGREWEVVKLWFDQVGLNYEIQYLAYVNPETGLMERWGLQLREGTKPIFYDWRDWRQVGPIKLSTTKVTLDSAVVIRFRNVRISPKPPDKAFAHDPGQKKAPAGEGWRSIS